jgi:hypothetical protein
MKLRPFVLAFLSFQTLSVLPGQEADDIQIDAKGAINKQEIL